MVILQLSQLSDQVLSSPEMSPSKSPRFRRAGVDIPSLPTALERTLRLKKGATQLGKTILYPMPTSHQIIHDSYCGTLLCRSLGPSLCTYTR